ncbi:MAG TPA: hypothetical protein VNF29_00210 [Candidatus Binataceae bacterium]|nr:hypothetical protein [Candidatus Binataceae bacterium]
MSRSFPILVLCAAIAFWSGCSATANSAAPKPAPTHTEGTATLDVTAGIQVISSVALPRGFAPLADHPPLWLQNGNEIGVVGSSGGHLVILGFSGPGWRNSRILAAETSAGSAEPGRILDLAVSPDTMTLAIAVAVAGQNRLDIVMRDLIATGPGRPITSFDGSYDMASLSWLNLNSIAISLAPSANQPVIPPPAPDDSGLPPEPLPKPSQGLQILVVAGPGSVVPMKLKCALGKLYWSPLGAYGVSAGGPGFSPALIDRRQSTCTRLALNAPVRVLGWKPGDESAFLYVQPIPASKSLGVFKHDIASGSDKLIAVSSGAAAYTLTGSILALGNQKLTFKAIDANPFVPVTAELAIFDPHQPEIAIKQLGFKTVPPMLAASTMAYSRATDRAAIQTFQPANPLALRKIITYTMHADNAFQLAYGQARGVAELSWSPKGQWIAIVDGNATGAALTVILPPA